MTFHSPAHGGDTAEETAAIHPEIIRTNILTRLDGASLASTSCISSEFQNLCSDQALWKTICDSFWPSTADPLISDVIPGFPSGHRSFVSDASSSVCTGGGDLLFRRSRAFSDECLPSSPSRLISAVDVHFESRPIFSRAVVIETQTHEFAYSAFRVDLLEPRELVPPETADIDGADMDACRSRVERGLTLNWILIDPEANRALNVSSITPVGARKHWLSGHLHASFEQVIPDPGSGGGVVSVQSWVVVEVGDRKLQVKEAGMMMEDVEGMVLTGKEGLLILRESMAAERRKKGTEEEKESYEMFMELKKEGNEKLQSLEMQMKEEMNKLDMSMVCMAIGAVTSILVSLRMLFV